jgi:hypothetical protein
MCLLPLWSQLFRQRNIQGTNNFYHSKLKNPAIENELFKIPLQYVFETNFTLPFPIIHDDDTAAIKA